MPTTGYYAALTLSAHNPPICHLHAGYTENHLPFSLQILKLEFPHVLYKMHQHNNNVVFIINHKSFLQASDQEWTILEIAEA